MTGITVSRDTSPNAIRQYEKKIADRACEG
jgi:hypothetical protein